MRRLKDNASDAFLEVVTPTDIPGLLARIPDCHTLVATGQKATEVVAERFGCGIPPVGGCVDIDVDGRPVRFWRMPSSSRAYPLPLEKKAAAYRKLFTSPISHESHVPFHRPSRRYDLRLRSPRHEPGNCRL